MALSSPMKLTSSASFSPSIRISLRLKSHRAQAKNFCRVLDIRVPKIVKSDLFQLIMAANDLQTMRASLLLDGGLKYEESTGRYILYGRATGIVENKTVTAKLYRQRGDSWTFIDSVTNTDTAETVKAQKYVTVVENNRYRVDVTGTTYNSNGTVSFYYNS